MNSRSLALTEKQIKTRWIDIKKQIRERPLLAYRVSIPLDKWDLYMHSIPTDDEINRIYNAIQNDRKSKTLRIKQALSQIVGYRESKQFSRRARVSDTVIRSVLEGKNDKAGYDVINRLELFLHMTMPGFELSLENPLYVDDYRQEIIGDLTSEVYRIAQNIKDYCFWLNDLSKHPDKDCGYFGKDPVGRLSSDINRLSDIKEQIASFWDTFGHK